MEPEAAVSHEGFSIPLIDFARFLHGDAAERAAAVLHGFQMAGFLYLVNHGIPASTVSATFRRSAQFFAQPMPVKEAITWTTPEANRGYVAPGREKVSQSDDRAAIQELRASVPGLKESLELGGDDVPEFHNPWPREDGELAGFREDMLEFYHRCSALQVEVMRAIGMAMGLGDAFFDPYLRRRDYTLRLLHYPAVADDAFADPAQMRIGEHTDYGSITLLFQDDRGGLQVKTPTGHFVDATPIADAVVVNAGDLLMRWRNDTIQSTMHRVVKPPKKDGEGSPARYSIAYFCTPDHETLIEALPGTYATEEDKHYEPLYAGEYLVSRLAATY